MLTLLISLLILSGIAALLALFLEIADSYLDTAFAAKKPACINVKIAKSDFRKGAISV